MSQSEKKGGGWYSQRKKLVLLFLFLIFLYWAPFIFISMRYSSRIISDLHVLPSVDAALVFGANLSRDGGLTPLLRERVEAGRRLWVAGKASRLVISNTAHAAGVMRAYLIDAGLPGEIIEMDLLANRTPDTCHAERKANKRTVVFLSQGFHLPRLLLQCHYAGVQGIAFPVERLGIIDRTKTPLLKRYFIRGKRYSREAALTWLAVLGIYR